MNSGNRCKECGTVIPPGSPGGLCGKCLFTLGLEPEQDGKPGAEGQKAGEPEDFEQQKSLWVGWVGDALSEKSGEKIGRYKLLQQIGEGGFGIVFMAEQQEPVHRRVALKIIKLGMDTREVIARFEAERQALAMMDHPNIARVLDGGATADGRPYFVMELVRGIPLTEYCDQASLYTRARLELFTKVCRAVQHAHQKGVIHRDLKPGNVLVTEHDGEPVPKVIDFGVAKALGQKLTEKTLFTRFETMIGTPAYMSPEQASLGGLDIDTRSDIYSLGVLLYELLTGVTPLDAGTLRKGAFDEIRRMIRETEPPKPSTRLLTLGQRLPDVARRRQAEPAALNRLVRGDLDWITMKALEKDRTRRYETASGLARDVERHLNHEPVIARPPSKLYEFQKTVRRHKFGFGAAAAVIMVLVAGVLVSTREAVRAWRAEQDQIRLRLVAEQAKRDATEKLWASYLAEARARRHSGEAGQRLASLAALSNAAAIRPSLELRNEAIAAMALADLQVIPGKTRRFRRKQEFAILFPAFERYALGDTNGTVSIRRIADDQELMRLPAVGGGPVRPWATGVSPDEKLLMVSYADRRARIWDLDSGKVVWEMPPGFAIGPGWKRVASCESNSITLYDLASRQKLKTIQTEETAIWPWRFSPDGRLLACVVNDTNVLVLDTESEKTLLTLAFPNTVFQLVWHPKGRFLATACGDNLIYIRDGLTGQTVRTLQGHRGTPVSMDFTHDGSLLASAGWDGRIILWDFGSGRQLVSIRTTGGIAFGPDDRTLEALGWDSDAFQFLEVARSREVRMIYEQSQVPGAPGGGAIFSANGQWLAYDTIGGVTLLDVQRNREAGSLRTSSGVCGFDANDQNVLLCDPEGRIFRWPIEGPAANGESRASPVPHQIAQGIAGVPFLSADGKVLAAVNGDDWRCRVFRTDTFTEVARTDVQRFVRWAAISPDDSLIATSAFHDYGVKVWDAHTGQLVKSLPTDEDITSVAFSPDGRWLVTGTGTEFRFWEVGSWVPGQRIPQEPNSFAPVMAFSPDGRILAGSYGFTVVRLFEAATGRVLADLEAPNPWTVTCLSFSPDGSQLAVCEGHNALHIWDLRAIREQLALMHLDWELPPYPPKSGEAASLR